MNKLIVIKKMKFKITWKFIAIGLYGLNEIPPILTYDELFEYLDMLLNEAPNEKTDKIISLFCEQNDKQKVDKILRKFVVEDNSDNVIQLRKWKAFILKRLLDDSPCDVLEGLIALMDFWVSMGQPEDCPHFFPADNDKLEIEKYFTQYTYDLLLKKNRVWLNKECSCLVESENHISSL